MWEGIEKETQVYIDKSISEDLTHIEDVYFARTASPKGGFWVAHLKGEEKLLGMVGLEYKTESDAELRRMSVHKDARQLGVGSRLLNHLLDHAKAEGFSRCILSTLVRMVPGRKLYEKHGFEEFKRVDLAPGVIEIFYQRPLTTSSSITN